MFYISLQQIVFFLINYNITCLIRPYFQALLMPRLQTLWLPF